MTAMPRLLMLLIAACALPAAQAAPSVFTPPDKSFSVIFPGREQCTASLVHIANTDVTQHRCSYANAQAQLSYTVIYYDGLRIPAGVDSGVYLRDALDAAARSSDSTVIDTRTRAVDGNPALDSTLAGKRTQLLTVSRYVLARQRLFVIEVGGWKGHAPSAIVNGFLDSFKLASGKR